MVLPTIAVTAGDPCGVGPEVILKALSASARSRGARLVVIGDASVFEPTARRLHRRLPAWVSFIDCRTGAPYRPGHASAQTGRASLAYLEEAVRLWRVGRIQGLVTAPVTKWAIQRTRPSFIGHTEFLARATRTRDVVMMFASDRLRIVVLTRHIPLGSVPRAMTPALVATTLRLAATALRRQFRIRRPRLAICGVNPHAGEGRIDTEEQRVMVPVLKRLRREGMVCDGPFAADGFFACLRPASRPGRQAGPVTYDAVICAYHDQGLIPFKMAARDRGCQVSLGLPLVRTSPDHGSALDIAGQGLADPGSMCYALALAIQLVQGKSQKSPF